jgi:putative FmdB family regulatory protein
MPIYEIICQVCNYQGEVLKLDSDASLECPACGSTQTKKLISPTSGLTGRTPQAVPGPADTSCCGQSVSEAGCSGPGSCCGKRF